MTFLRNWIKSVFGFSRTETNAFIIMLPLMILIIFSEPIYRWWFASRPREKFNDERVLDSLVATWKWEKRDSVKESPKPLPEKSISFFKFNPNLTSMAEWGRLGLDERMAKRIQNYRSKGGKFKIKADLQKIYGIDSLWFKKAYAYIDLPEKAQPDATGANGNKKPEGKKDVLLFDLNKADTSELIRIYGIGPKLAGRIVKYREKLGGFVSPGQLKEVYGLDSAVISRLNEKSFIADKFVPVTISLNRADEKELAVHPYLGWKIARIITTYRFQHGPFKSIDDLDQIKLLDKEALLRAKPYLTLD